MESTLSLCFLILMVFILLGTNSALLSSGTFTIIPGLKDRTCKQDVRHFSHSGLKLFHCINMCFRSKYNVCVGVFYKESHQEGYACSQMDSTDLVALSDTISLERQDCAQDLVQSALDSQLTSSSTYHEGGRASAIYARLDTDGPFELPGCWSMAPGDQNPYIQIDFLELKRVTGVVTQGWDYSSERQWMTEYRVLTSADCSNWDYLTDGDGVAKVFAGNDDMVTKVTNLFVSPVIARCVRVNPTSYNRWPSMRFGVLACP